MSAPSGSGRRPGEPSLKSEAWALFDRIVARAPGARSNPWWRARSGELSYRADYATLRKLLAVSVLLRAPSQSGVPALALDVWTAYELRRAGFEPDRVWPRASEPRILPSTLVALRAHVTNRAQRELLDRLITSGETFGGETGATANILGKNYVKQVDVVMSAWNTGPEIMISTKRMDSSFGKNAANRVEESYGDAKNLRSRYPRAALGFVFGLRSTAFTARHRATADWIVDLLGKLGREEDAYDAVALIVPDWSSSAIGENQAGENDAGENEIGENEIGENETGDVWSADQGAGWGDGIDSGDGAGSAGRIGVADRAGTGDLAGSDARGVAPPDAAGLVEPWTLHDLDGADPFAPTLPLELPDSELDRRLGALPDVRLRHDLVPASLGPDAFFAVTVHRVLDNCPINFHVSARRRRAHPRVEGPAG